MNDRVGWEHQEKTIYILYPCVEEEENLNMSGGLQGKAKRDIAK